MGEYHPDYSFLNSVHNVLRNAGFIPKTVSGEELFRDLDIEMRRDEDLDGGYMEEVSRKIVIRHEMPLEGGGFRSKCVVDGLGFFVVERDCNNEYDIDMFGSRGGGDGGDVKKCSLLMREGDMYAPIYCVDAKSGGRRGVLSVDEELVREVMRRVE